MTPHRPAQRWLRQACQSWPLAAGVLAAASFVTLLAAIPEIFVPDTGLGFVDAWYYVGFAQRLPESMRQYSASLYQAERLAWNLPGYLVNQVAPPLAANYLLKGAYFAATVVFLFGALRQICGSRTATFVSALASLYSFVAHSLGASYVDGAANTYFLIAVYAANRVALGEGSVARSAFTAGIACVAVLFTHFGLFLVLPLFAGYALLTWAQMERRNTPAFPVGVISFLVGAATAWMAASAVYMYWGVPGRPLQQQLDFTSGPTLNVFALPNSQAWILLAYWLLLPLTVVVWILPRVVVACGAGWRAALRVPPAYWLLLSVCGLWTVMTVMRVLNVPWIMLPFYASYLIPATFLAFGPVLRPIVEGLSARSYWRLLGLLFVGAFAGYRFNDPRFAAEAAITAAACLLLATLLRAATRIPEDRRAVAVLTVLVLAIVTLDFATADYTVQFRNGYKYTPMAQTYHAPEPESQWPVSRGVAFEGAVNAAKALAPRLSGRHYYFWYNGDDALGMFFRSVGSMFYAWSTRDLLNERFQGIDDESIHSLLPQPGGRMRDLLILTRSADVRVEDSPLRLQWTERFSAAGTTFYAHYFGVDMVRAAGFESSPRRLGLATRFPCSSEAAGAALWYDRGNQTTRNSGDRDALQALFSAEQLGPVQCLAAYRTLTERFATTENGDPYVPLTTTCDAELALAKVYVSEVFDEPLRQATRPAHEMARTAQQERQPELCRVAVGEIRRAYFEAIFGVNDVPAATLQRRLAAVGVDFEPTAARIRLASRFPCTLEVAAAARWWDGGTNWTSADRKALEDLLRGAQQGTMACLSAYKGLTQRLGAATQRSAYLPATATCESELAIAETYVSEVFDEPLRQAARPALEMARAAQQERQPELCRVGVGEIRRTYIEAIFGVNDVPGATLQQRLAAVGVDFEPTAARIRLASRFPCTLEVAAAARWWDGGTNWTSADRKALEDLLRGAQQGTMACLSAYKGLTQRLGAATQRSAYLPATATCESELAIAEAYVSAVFDEPLRQAARPALEMARTAQQERQPELCRVGVGEIRRAYFEAIFGANDVPAATLQQRLAAVGVDFEPTAARIRLASRFPCTLEVAAAARWWDGGTNWTSADRKALEDLLRGAQQGTMACLSAYKGLTQRLGAATQRSAYLPATATCESELAIAETYVSEVFDEPLRQAARPALEMARTAQQERQPELCRVGVGEIRRAYFEAIFGANDVPTATLPLRLAAVGVEFEPTSARIRLASRFPCTLEVAAAARWWDGGTNWTSADRKALEDLFREAQQDTMACLSAYKRLTQRLAAAQQRSAYLPATATCESELAIAEAYVSAVFDEPLRQKTIPTLGAARVAQQQGRINECRQSVGEIRRAYFEAIYGSNRPARPMTPTAARQSLP